MVVSDERLRQPATTKAWLHTSQMLVTAVVEVLLPLEANFKEILTSEYECADKKSHDSPGDKAVCGTI